MQVSSLFSAGMMPGTDLGGAEQTCMHLRNAGVPGELTGYESIWSLQRRPLPGRSQMLIPVLTCVSLKCLTYEGRPVVSSIRKLSSHIVLSLYDVPGVIISALRGLTDLICTTK